MATATKNPIPEHVPNADDAGADFARGMTADQALKLASHMFREGRGLTEIAEKDEAGFSLIRDKDKLVGTPFVIVNADKEMGEIGTYWHVRIVTDKGKALCFDDSGSGIPAQMETLGADTNKTPIVCPRGLRVSKYTYQGRPVATYYIDEVPA